MKFVLILIMYTTSGSVAVPPAMTTAQFDDRDACNAALKTLQSDYQIANRHRFTGYCVPSSSR